MKQGLIAVCLTMLIAGCQSALSVSDAEVSEKKAAQTKPNILFILSDDAGFADFGFQGSKVMKTPNIDKFAATSTKFSQAYVSAAVCGPSRAGLLTGRYQQRFGFEENNVPGYMSNSALDGEDMGLPLDQVTVGDYLQQAGYETGIIGKWHQGNADRYHPTKRGFDHFFGFRGGARSYYDHDEAYFKERPEDRLERGFQHFEKTKKYLTDQLADEAISFISEDREDPFFLFLSFTAVHTPMEATQEDMDMFPELAGDRKVLAAMNLAMDRAIGKVLASLEDHGLYENTIVVFTNDNGGPSDTNVSNNAPLSGTKANHLEGGIRVPFLMKWPGVVEAGQYDFPISTLDLLPTFAAAAGMDVSKIPNLDGVNIIPYVLGQTEGRPHQTLYWKKETRGAIRHDDWKLLRFPDRPAELYNLTEDISEVHNLANEKPDLVKALYKKLFDWELTLERPLWQLKREYEGMAMVRMDTYRQNAASAEAVATPAE